MGREESKKKKEKKKKEGKGDFKSISLRNCVAFSYPDTSLIFIHKISSNWQR